MNCETLEFKRKQKHSVYAMWVRRKNYSLVKEDKFCKNLLGHRAHFRMCDLLDLRFVDNLLADNFVYTV
jgi:hypothetical protein